MSKPWYQSYAFWVSLWAAALAVGLPWGRINAYRALPKVSCYAVRIPDNDFFGVSQAYYTLKSPVIKGSFVNFTDLQGQQYALAGNLVISHAQCLKGE